ncbi:50S ribosomal protein L24 [Nanobdella aerobiophila]|uniref:Large ribosomal subunit protein uL24 n=1 Tax=Nanobdella aerobiophila TaxID=2586965 RepID=A0A915WRZ7_9ARCH|nr:50S ribosomal protein L24 [Nanobdella aerobiophila]BBL45804.1 50S ribosomal protein L24 [Nanobdella aerobiophila]
MVLRYSSIDYSNWSKSWKSSIKPKKQRKYLINAPLHIRGKIISSMLSKDIKNIIGVNSLSLRVGDYVKILRGKYRKVEGFVFYIDRKRYKVYIDNAKFSTKKGQERYRPIHYSKLLILRLNLKDKERLEAIKRKMRSKNIPEDKINSLIDNYSVKDEELSKVLELNKKFK